MNHRIKGTGVALVTPFNEDMTVDFNGLNRLINHVTEGGVDYLVVMGTTGEAATLSKEEKSAVLDAVKKYNAGKLPLVFGIGGNSTQAVLDEILESDLEGVDALLSVSPYYNKPTQKGIEAHFTAIADACPIPVILYNVPGRTMSNMEAQTTLNLANHSNIIGIKEASGIWTQCVEIASNKPDDFLLISGDDLLTIATNAIGGEGVISVLANAIPQEFYRLENGNGEEQNEATFRIAQLNSMMYEESNPVGVKNLLKQLEVCGDQVRSPMMRASQELQNKIKAVL